MAEKFKGKNGLKSTFELYYYRTKFTNEAYEEGVLGPKCAIDLNFAEYQHYGQLDLEGNPLEPNESKLVPMRTDDGVFYVFDFVADMFTDLKTHIDLAIMSGRLCKSNPIFNDFGPVSAYVSPEMDYKVYLDSIMTVYLKEVIPNFYGINNIMNFESFVKNFFAYIRDFAQEIPITYTGWLISKRAGIKHTGLSVSIDDMLTSVDQEKIDRLINTPQFPYYKNLLLNLGFAFDFQNPAAIFADLGSPAIADKFNKFNIASIDTLFQDYFFKSYYKDIDILIDKIISFYNIYVTLNPQQIKFNYCKNKTKWEWIYREKVTQTEVDNDYPIGYWLTKLVELRNAESGGKLGPGKVKKIQREAIKLEKKFDKPTALDYINNETKSLFYERDYGFRDWEERILKRTQIDVKAISGKSVFNGGGY
jgi:hypothetical protein